MLNPALATLILQLVNGVIAAAPSIIEGIAKAKALIQALFTSGIITVEQQNALMAHVDGLGALAAAGIPPLAWMVEPDPS